MKLTRFIYRLPFISFGAVLLLIGVTGWFFGSSGLVTGVEFSPERFSHRSFRYYQWCGIPVTPRQTHEWQSPTDEYLHQQNFVPDAGAVSARWDLVKGFAPGIRGWHGKAKSMCQSLGCWNKSDRWIVWSNENPELPKVVWPQVISWARDRKYNEVHALFSFTELEAAKSPEDVTMKIEKAKEIALY